ncbi:MAG: 2-isopropylmalate synthase [Lachnospiraceae bacterium]|nr:2-isopropylmalate synthase [Lachnospiraceae bacterium]
MRKPKISEKYRKTYHLPPVPCYDWVRKDTITAPPIWCSVDLRDGNQALIDPMSLETKLEFFKILVDVGFKEIEVGFPASSDTEYEFIRALIERDMIPEDVTIQVLTQAREHIIRKTFEAVKGAPKAVVHLYNSTSVEQREQVFKKDKKDIKKLAVDGAKLLKKLADETEGNFMFEYSPESFSQTEPEFALEVCNAVLDVWKPTKTKKAIINLPSTVQVAMPHVFASQIEYLHKNLKYREGVVLSVHPHNDRGTGVGDAELGVLAGADRVEGTLFGNGERTGNVDIVTVALNMMTHGVDSGLDFSNIMEIREAYERFTNMKVHERTPYAGDLVFTAFSGSHQDAISKGMAWRDEGKTGKRWDIPYLPIDPSDVGREYESDVIRINSTSGKGGVAFVLKQQFGFSLPAAMKEEVGYLMKGVSDRKHQELKPQEIFEVFEDEYIRPRGIFTIPECHFRQENGIVADVTICQGEDRRVVTAQGNGRLDAVSNAIKMCFGIDYEVSTYEEHAVSHSSSSKAAAYFGITVHGAKGDQLYWGVGVDEDIIKASIAALASSVNKIAAALHVTRMREERLVEILCYIQRNYQTVTLDGLAEAFHLSKPYLSKYIKEKAGETFQDVVRLERMKRARALLKESGRSVESVAAEVGYENVEHFNRLFRKTYDMTPVQYRRS